MNLLSRIKNIAISTKINEWTGHKSENHVISNEQKKENVPPFYVKQNSTEATNHNDTPSTTEANGVATTQPNMEPSSEPNTTTTEEVISAEDSNLAERLKKREFVVHELVETEENYVKDLGLIVEVSDYWEHFMFKLKWLMFTWNK